MVEMVSIIPVNFKRFKKLYGRPGRPHFFFEKALFSKGPSKTGKGKLAVGGLI